MEKTCRAVGLSDQIRNIAKSKYVGPAFRSGKREFSIAVRELMDHAEASGIDTHQRVPAFCTSILKDTFLRDNHLEVVSVDGPASKRSTTVVVHYKRREKSVGNQVVEGMMLETPAQRAVRLTTKLRGLMKGQIAAHGGAEGFLRWVRSDEDEE